MDLYGQLETQVRTEVTILSLGFARKAPVLETLEAFCAAA